MERVESRHRNMDIHVAYAIYSTVYSLEPHDQALIKPSWFIACISTRAQR